MERVLIAIGITPNTEKVGLDTDGVTLNKGGYVEIDANMRTNIPNIYAIGDCTGKLALAHVAMAQALVAAESIAGAQTLPIPPNGISLCRAAPIAPPKSPALV